MCACVCAASTSFSQFSGHFRPVSSSAPVVSRGAVAAERSPPICEGELCGVSSPSVWLGWNANLLEVLCRIRNTSCECVPSPPQTPSSTPSPPCWSCLTMWSSVWLPAGTTLVLPLEWRTTSWRTSRPLRGVRWRPAALTCSSVGSEGSGPQEGRSVAGLLCWEQCRGASDGR